MSSRPQSEASSIDIAEIEKSFPAPPKARYGVRKTLPPLPPMAEIERQAAVMAALMSNVRASIASASRYLPSTREAASEKQQQKTPSWLGISVTRPPKPLPKDENYSKPPIASANPSFKSIDPKRELKYGTGKYATIELSPQPSEDSNDPLNWPIWKKDLNLIALLLMVALIGAMKTAFVSIYSVVAIGGGVSYTAASTLTAIPLIVSAASGMTSTMAARIWGKRPVYLVSMLLVFVGAAWNTSTEGEGKFAQTVAARVFQGLGWGAFDTLVLGSILDTYFEHERQSRILLYNTVSFGTTWGAPLIGGAVAMRSSQGGGFSTQFEILTPLLVIAMLLIIVGSPETTYNRSSFVDEQQQQPDDVSFFLPPVRLRSQSRLPQMTVSKDAALEYLRQQPLKPQSYKGPAIANVISLLAQAPRAAAAPSTMLLFIVTLLPHVALWGLTSSLSLLFTPSPFSLTAPSIGLLFFAPFVLGTAATAGIPLACEYWRKRRFLSRNNTQIFATTLAAGATLASIGILGFGLYIVGSAERPEGDGAIWDLEFTYHSIRFPVISILLGLLAFGSATLDGTAMPVMEESAAFTSANMSVALRSVADMAAALACLRNVVAGVFVLGIPTAVWTWDGLRASAIGSGVVNIFVAAAIAAIFVDLGEHVRRWDGVVMGLVDLSGLKSRGSFFDTE